MHASLSVGQRRTVSACLDSCWWLCACTCTYSMRMQCCIWVWLNLCLPLCVCVFMSGLWTTCFTREERRVTPTVAENAHWLSTMWPEDDTITRHINTRGIMCWIKDKQHCSLSSKTYSCSVNLVKLCVLVESLSSISQRTHYMWVVLPIAFTTGHDHQ